MRYGLSAMLLLAISASSIRAAGPLLREIKPWTIATKSWGSDAVVVGTVTFIERELIEAKRHPNATETMAHLIAVVKVDSVIKGWKTTTHVRVGFVEIEPSNEHGFNLDDGNMCRILNLLEHETYLLFLNKHPDFAFYTFDFVRAAPLPVPGPARYCPDVVAAEIAVGEQAALFDVMRALREGDSIDLENPLDSKPSMADATLTTEAQRLTALRSGKIDLNPADFDSAFDDNDEISIPLFSAQSGLTLLREKWLGSPETGETYPRRAEKVAFRSAKSSWARPRGAERECWRQPLFAERKATFSAQLGFQNRRWGGVGRIGRSAFRDVSLLSTSSIVTKYSRS